MTPVPLILISNDDGIDAPGILALAAAAEALGEVWMVAPDREQSARSHALTMHEPLRASPRGPRAYAVSGTPADSVYIAVHHLLPRPPALMLSGINRGPNLGDDTWYSGTVGAARESSFGGVPSLAVSMEARPEVPDPERPWAQAAALAVEVAARMLQGEAPGLLLNLNVPDPRGAPLPALKVAPLGARHYAPLVAVQRDPRGRSYYWIGGSSAGFEDQPGSDGYHFHRGHPTLTALRADMFDAEASAALPAWLQRGAPSPAVR